MGKDLPPTVICPGSGDMTAPQHGESPGGEKERPDAVVPSTSGQDPFIGVQIGAYRIVSVLGKGGFAMVFKGRDTTLERDAALKFLINPLEPHHRELFEREAKAIAALSKHCGIVQVYAWGEHQGRAYMAMEFVQSSAKDLIAKHPKGVPVATALRIVAECAEALAYAHRNGIIHRDIKPANILIEAEDGRAKLSDFGLARFYESGQVTASGMISGSPSYMSPEQASGKRVDARTDIFSLGVTLYELLSGRRPFEGSTMRETIDLVLQNKRVPLRERRPDLPSALIDLVEIATAHSPAHRFQTAQDMAGQLRKALNALEGSADLSTVRIRKRPLSKTVFHAAQWAAAIAIVAVLVSVLPLWERAGPENTVLAEARQLMDRGEPQAAEDAYRKVLEGAPGDSEALYGLGYALLQQARITEAEAEFRRVGDAALSAEGLAAVAYDRDGEGARAVLETARSAGSSAYPQTLLASLDLAAGRPRDAAEALAKVLDGDFHFGWQRGRCRELLARAYYHLGEYEKALQTLQEAGASGASPLSSVERAYVELAAAQVNSLRQTEVSKRIQEIVRLKNDPSFTQPTPEDEWTTRPYTYFVLASDVLNSRFAVESGLADVLPWMLGKALAERTPMQMVERDVIAEILAEQVLSASLSKPGEEARLGQVVGARLIIRCEFSWAMKQDYLNTRVVDTETTRPVPTEGVILTRQTKPDALAEELAAGIWEAVQSQFPRCGRLMKTAEGAKINIGAGVGVREGMRFAICPTADRKNYERLRLPGKAIVVTGEPAADSSAVQPEGFALEDIPETGWYVFEETTSS